MKMLTESKRRLLALVAVVFALVLSACGPTSNEVVALNEDGSGTWDIAISFTKQDLEAVKPLTVEKINSTLKETLPAGMQMQDFKADGNGYTGKFSIDFKDFSDLEDKVYAIAGSPKHDGPEADRFYDFFMNATRGGYTKNSFNEGAGLLFEHDLPFRWALKALRDAEPTAGVGTNTSIERKSLEFKYGGKSTKQEKKSSNLRGSRSEFGLITIGENGGYQRAGVLVMDDPNGDFYAFVELSTGPIGDSELDRKALASLKKHFASLNLPNSRLLELSSADLGMSDRNVVKTPVVYFEGKTLPEVRDSLAKLLGEPKDMKPIYTPSDGRVLWGRQVPMKEIFADFAKKAPSSPYVNDQALPFLIEPVVAIPLDSHISNVSQLGGGIVFDANTQIRTEGRPNLDSKEFRTELAHLFGYASDINRPAKNVLPFHIPNVVVGSKVLVSPQADGKVGLTYNISLKQDLLERYGLEPADMFPKDYKVAVSDAKDGVALATVTIPAAVPGELTQKYGIPSEVVNQLPVVKEHEGKLTLEGSMAPVAELLKPSQANKNEVDSFFPSKPVPDFGVRPTGPQAFSIAVAAPKGFVFKQGKEGDKPSIGSIEDGALTLGFASLEDMKAADSVQANFSIELKDANSSIFTEPWFYYTAGGVLLVLLIALILFFFRKNIANAFNQAAQKRKQAALIKAAATPATPAAPVAASPVLEDPSMSPPVDPVVATDVANPVLEDPSMSPPVDPVVATDVANPVLEDPSMIPPAADMPPAGDQVPPVSAEGEAFGNASGMSAPDGVADNTGQQFTDPPSDWDEADLL